MIGFLTTKDPDNYNVNNLPNGSVHSTSTESKTTTSQLSQKVGKVVSGNSLSSLLLSTPSESDSVFNEEWKLRIEEKYEKFNELDDQIFKNYAYIAGHFKQKFSVKKESLVLKNKEASWKIRASTLYTLVNKAFRELHQLEQSMYIVKGKRVIFSKQGEDVKAIFLTEKKLGQGGYGKVEETVDVVSKKIPSSAFKHAFCKPEKDYWKDAYIDVRYERQLLKELHPHSEEGTYTIGLQKPPHMVIELPKHKVYEYQKPSTFITSPDAIDYVGYIGYQYDSSLWNFDFSRITLRNRIDCADQLLYGLYHCSDKLGLCLGDIKPCNCLIKKIVRHNGHNSYECVLSDFGGARTFRDFLNNGWGTHTSSYVHNTDKEVFNKFYLAHRKKEATASEKENISVDIERLLKARDVYALSFILKDIFKRQDDLPKRFAQEIKDLIAQMSEAEYTKRISIAVAFKAFRDICKKYHLKR